MTHLLQRTLFGLRQENYHRREIIPSPKGSLLLRRMPRLDIHYPRWGLPQTTLLGPASTGNRKIL